MDKPVSVGGQAVIEGVMMRAPKSLAIAVRRPNGEIALKESAWRSIWEKFAFLRWPFFRGSVVMIEAMMNGIQALNFSANEAMPDEEKGADGSHRTDSSFVTMLYMAFSVVLAIALFKFLPHLAATWAGLLFGNGKWSVDDWLYHVVDGGVKVSLFVGYVAAIGMMKDIERVFMYHGAEHMSIFTYEAKEALTVENAARKSRFHPRCGTSFLMVVILVFIVLSALLLPFLPEFVKPGDGKSPLLHVGLVLLKLPLLIPVAGISYEFNRFAGRHCDLIFIRPLMWPGMWMQRLTTRQPSADQLEIALISLRTALRRHAISDVASDDGDVKSFESFDAFVSDDIKDSGRVTGQTDVA